MSKEYKLGDIVYFKVRAHPTMGEPYEVIGRVEKDARGYHAGGRYLHTALGEVEVISAKDLPPVSNAGLIKRLVEALKSCNEQLKVAHNYAAYNRNEAFQKKPKYTWLGLDQIDDIMMAGVRAEELIMEVENVQSDVLQNP